MLRSLALFLVMLSTDTAAKPVETRDISYGPASRHAYDVYWDDSQRNAPMIVMLHGGGWRIGDKAASRVTGHKVDHWRGKGVIFVSVNTRLLPTKPDGQARDFAAAVAHIQKNAAKWGGDGRNVLLMGHSAGAHIAALVGTDATLQRQAGMLPVRGTVSLDTEALDLTGLMSGRTLPLFKRAFGSAPAYWKTVSPLDQMDRGAAPVLAVCSTERRNSCSSARSFAKAGRARRVAISVLPVAMSHGEINANLGAPSRYTSEVSRWIDRRMR